MEWRGLAAVVVETGDCPGSVQEWEDSSALAEVAAAEECQRGSTHPSSSQIDQSGLSERRRETGTVEEGEEDYAASDSVEAVVAEAGAISCSAVEEASSEAAQGYIGS